MIRTTFDRFIGTPTDSWEVLWIHSRTNSFLDLKKNLSLSEQHVYVGSSYMLVEHFAMSTD